MNFWTREWKNADGSPAIFTNWHSNQPDREYEECAQTGWGWNGNGDDNDKRAWHDTTCILSPPPTLYSCRFEKEICP